MRLTPLGHEAFGLDALGVPFLVLFALVWGIAALYAAVTIDRASRARFWAYYMPAAAGGVLIALTQDAISFYFAFALMALPSWGLVSHSRTTQARRAGRIYLLFTVLSEMLLLAALMLLAASAGSIQLAEMRASLAGSTYTTLVMALVLGSVAFKIGSLGVSGILPLSYTYTPTAAAAALAGASVKVGSLALLRLIPFGVPELANWGVACIVVGLATAFVAAALGVLTTVPKSVLGYSSASQMGLITVAVGAGLAGGPEAATGAVVAYSLHHGLAKTSLFLGEDIASASSGKGRNLALVALAIPALALVGAPFTSGFVAKYSLYGALDEVSVPVGHIAHSLLPWAAVGTALLMARFLSLVYTAPARNDRRGIGPKAIWAVTLLLSMLVVWMWPAEWASDAAHHALELKSIWGAIWPVLLVGLVALGLRLTGRDSYKGFVPPGDWLPVLDELMARVGSSADRPPTTKKGTRTNPLAPLLRVEGTLTTWMVAGSVFLLLVVGLSLLAALL